MWSRSCRPNQCSIVLNKLTVNRIWLLDCIKVVTLSRSGDIQIPKILNLSSIPSSTSSSKIQTSVIVCRKLRKCDNFEEKVRSCWTRMNFNAQIKLKSKCMSSKCQSNDGSQINILRVCSLRSMWQKILWPRLNQWCLRRCTDQFRVFTWCHDPRGTPLGGQNIISYYLPA